MSKSSLSSDKTRAPASFGCIRGCGNSSLIALHVAHLASFCTLPHRTFRRIIRTGSEKEEMKMKVPLQRSPDSAHQTTLAMLLAFFGANPGSLNDFRSFRDNEFRIHLSLRLKNLPLLEQIDLRRIDLTMS